MMKKFLLSLLVVGVQFFGFSQKAFISYGHNFTKYDYKNSNGDSNSNLKGNDGSAIEIGYQMPLKKYKTVDLSNFYYTVSLTLDQFNAKGGDLNNTYNWETTYVGLQNKFGYSLFKKKSGFEAIVYGGFNFTSILKGEQTINQIVYDISKNEEFSGVLIKPFLEFEIKYAISEKIDVKMGYSISRTSHLTNQSTEKLAFNNSQIQLGFYFPIK
jgi:hypothetical protein